MDTALKRVGPYLSRLSDGETGERSMWIQPTQEAMRANPDVEAIPDSDWGTYTDEGRFRLLPSATLRPEAIRFCYRSAFDFSYPQFRVLRERYGLPDVRFQVGIPSPTDLSTRIFGRKQGAPGSAIAAAIQTATVNQIADIFAIAADDVVFQYETIAVPLRVFEAASGTEVDEARAAASEFVELAARAPAGTRFGLHLCVGDFHHHAQARLPDVRPLVLVANAVAEAWPDGRHLDFIHAPFAAAADPPPFDDAFYEPLRELLLPDSVDFVAGFVHESLDLPAHGRLLERIDTLVGRRVGVAAACGLGRRPSDDQAWDAMDKAIALIQADVG